MYDNLQNRKAGGVDGWAEDVRKHVLSVRSLAQIGIWSIRPVVLCTHRCRATDILPEAFIDINAGIDPDASQTWFASPTDANKRQG